jgi:hypothetical protein
MERKRIRSQDVGCEQDVPATMYTPGVIEVQAGRMTSKPTGKKTQDMS